ncbi:MAG TPA: hypothetical protein VIO39_07365 [Methylotenera sp.]
MKPIQTSIFLFLLTLHIILILLMGTDWAASAVWFTNVISATVFLPLIAFDAIGLSVFGHNEGFGLPGLTVFGIVLLCSFWLPLHYGLAVLIKRIFSSKA